jgi:hypothetical protein
LKYCNECRLPLPCVHRCHVYECYYECTQVRICHPCISNFHHRSIGDEKQFACHDCIGTIYRSTSHLVSKVVMQLILEYIWSQPSIPKLVGSFEVTSIKAAAVASTCTVSNSGIKALALPDNSTRLHALTIESVDIKTNEPIDTKTDDSIGLHDMSFD